MERVTYIGGRPVETDPRLLTVKHEKTIFGLPYLKQLFRRRGHAF